MRFKVVTCFFLTFLVVTLQADKPARSPAPETAPPDIESRARSPTWSSPSCLSRPFLNRLPVHRRDGHGRRGWWVGVGRRATTAIVAGRRGHRLRQAKVIGGHAEEAVRVADLAGKRRRRSGRVRLERLERTSVVGDKNVVSGDPRTCPVRSRPREREAGAGGRCRQRMTELVGGDASIVLAIVSVLIGALVSKTTVAWALMTVPVARPLRGWMV